MRAAKLLAVICCCGLYGCSIVQYYWPEEPPSDQELYESYSRTKLKTSSSAAVLATLQKRENEILSQSTGIIALSGQKKKGHKLWLNMVAFDENELTARRKYLFIVDDRPNILEEPRKKLSFDCEVVLETEVLDKPYADENARRIAILRQVLEKVRRDVDEVGLDNKTVAVSGMLINQALEAALVRLDSSPALASRLSEPAGVDFSHINLGEGRLRMLVEDNIAVIKMKLGSLTKKAKDIEGM